MKRSVLAAAVLATLGYAWSRRDALVRLLDRLVARIWPMPSQLDEGPKDHHLVQIGLYADEFPRAAGFRLGQLDILGPPKDHRDYGKSLLAALGDPRRFAWMANEMTDGKGPKPGTELHALLQEIYREVHTEGRK